MKFTLTYEGELSSSGNGAVKAKQKWDIRRQIHPQLLELWSSSINLKRLPRAANNIVKEGGYIPYEFFHESERDTRIHIDREDRLNLLEPVKMGEYAFSPLVRGSLLLVCGLNILFLRKEEPGHLITQSGDLDNRIKTLLDGLRIPTLEELQRFSDALPSPLHCLMESDTLVTELNVKTDRLLTKPESSIKEVKLIIEVTTKATLVKSYNLPLLGD